MAVRRKHIRALVERLLANQGISEPPIRVVDVARSLGVRVRKEPADSELSGFLLRDARSRTAVIGVNSLHHPNRQNFTAAHELGHFLLHEGERVHIDRSALTYQVNLRTEASSQGTDREEVEANVFAAELLMPAQMLARDLAEHDALDLIDEDSKVLRELAGRYRVSSQALTFRLANLGYIRL